MQSRGPHCLPNGPGSRGLTDKPHTGCLSEDDELGGGLGGQETGWQQSPERQEEDMLWGSRPSTALIACWMGSWVVRSTEGKGRGSKAVRLNPPGPK